MKRLHAKKVSYRVSFELVLDADKHQGKARTIKQVMECVMNQAHFPDAAIETLQVIEEVK